ncbi:fibrous sheath CABYR-binding protein-like [Thrips palmi]|uniref:Fibrous sheath CABYR-binding protein-like n=1 Tax=Thrips palmi TaxID=161013 RepID=A0A6P9AFI1_THRPL|nr:fibrous sheath CABYR-binding protein-like [Thrips palmi]
MTAPRVDPVPEHPDDGGPPPEAAAADVEEPKPAAEPAAQPQGAVANGEPKAPADADETTDVILTVDDEDADVEVVASSDHADLVQRMSKGLLARGGSTATCSSAHSSGMLAVPAVPAKPRGIFGEDTSATCHQTTAASPSTPRVAEEASLMASKHTVGDTGAVGAASEHGAELAKAKNEKGGKSSSALGEVERSVCLDQEDARDEAGDATRSEANVADEGVQEAEAEVTIVADAAEATATLPEVTALADDPLPEADLPDMPPQAPDIAEESDFMTGDEGVTDTEEEGDEGAAYATADERDDEQDQEAGEETAVVKAEPVLEKDFDKGGVGVKFGAVVDAMPPANEQQDEQGMLDEAEAAAPERVAELKSECLSQPRTPVAASSERVPAQAEAAEPEAQRTAESESKMQTAPEISREAVTPEEPPGESAAAGAVEDVKIFKNETEAEQEEAVPESAAESDINLAAGPLPAVPEAGEPEVGEPEADKPEAGVPEVAKPEAGEPEVAEPEAGGPEVGEPEASEPEVGEPEAEAEQPMQRFKSECLPPPQRSTAPASAEHVPVRLDDAAAPPQTEIQEVPIGDSDSGKGDSVTDIDVAEAEAEAAEPAPDEALPEVRPVPTEHAPTELAPTEQLPTEQAPAEQAPEQAPPGDAPPAALPADDVDEATPSSQAEPQAPFEASDEAPDTTPETAPPEELPAEDAVGLEAKPPSEMKAPPEAPAEATPQTTPEMQASVRKAPYNSECLRTVLPPADDVAQEIAPTASAHSAPQSPAKTAAQSPAKSAPQSAAQTAAQSTAPSPAESAAQSPVQSAVLSPAKSATKSGVPSAAHSAPMSASPSAPADLGGGDEQVGKPEEGPGEPDQSADGRAEVDAVDAEWASVLSVMDAAARRRSVLARTMEACERELGPLHATLRRLHEKIRALDLPELAPPPPRRTASLQSATAGLKRARSTTAIRARQEAASATTPCPYCGLQLVPEADLSPLARMHILLAQRRQEPSEPSEPSDEDLHREDHQDQF